jgi:serine/threonine protein kinase
MTAPIGAGGMGEVWRAVDTNLGRHVAIKILPDTFAHDPERLARFEREARTLASLNHPNIAVIHGLETSGGSRGLVMEFVDGPTLADRVAQGAIPIDEALPIARQIAEALEAAHDQGIVHRDLKPANIKVRSDGTVKVLDFGLAKAVGSGVASREAGVGKTLADSPTIAAPAMTQAGAILGTAAYMSPEQARGKNVDRGADIWAFGCVLYEMLAGKPAFRGDTLTDIVASVLTHEPDWTALPAETPAAVRGLLRRCLKKDPARRIHDSADARIEIEEAIAEPAPRPQQAAATTRRPAALQFAGWLVAALAAVAWLATQIGSLGPAPPSPQVVRLELNMPPGVETNETATPNMAISPDGTRVAYIGAVGGLRRIYVRRLGEFDSTPLQGTETANICSFSPDGETLFFVSSDRILKKLSLSDGLVTPLVRDADYAVGVASWGPTDALRSSGRARSGEPPRPGRRQSR